MRVHAAVLLLSFALTTTDVRAQRARVEIDHGTGAIRLIVQRGARVDTSAMGDEAVVRLPHNVPVEIDVVNTNTALYNFSRTSASVALPEAQALSGFVSRLTPYVPELRSALSGSRGAGFTEPPAQNVADARLALAVALGTAERSLMQIDEAVFGERGLQPTITTTLLALEQMRRNVAPEVAAEPLRRRLRVGKSCGSQEPVRLPTAESLLSSLVALSGATGNMRVAMLGQVYDDARWRALRDSARVLDVRAQSALADFESLLSSTYRVERLVGIVANACSKWSAGVARGSRTSGRAITIRVEPRTEAELARIADRTVSEYTVLVQPQPFLRPAIAIAGIAAPGGRFPTFGTKDVEGGVSVYESGQTDRRFGLGGTLGFTWRGLDHRDGSGLAVWLPEVVVAAGDVTGAGLGTGFSLGFLKVSAGAMWMRQQSLEGARVGDVVADALQVRIVDGYGKPKLYFALSLFDWAPFADRIPGR